MKFAVNNTFSPGRRAGARNRLSTTFLTDLAEARERDGKDALKVMAKEDPSGFVRAVTSLLPKELDITHNALSELSDEELDRMLAWTRAELAKSIEKPLIEAKVG